MAESAAGDEDLDIEISVAQTYGPDWVPGLVRTGSVRPSDENARRLMLGEW